MCTKLRDNESFGTDYFSGSYNHRYLIEPVAITEQPFSTSHSLFNSCDLPLFQKSSKIFGLNLKCVTLHFTKKKVFESNGNVCACILLLQEFVNVN